MQQPVAPTPKRPTSPKEQSLSAGSIKLQPVKDQSARLRAGSFISETLPAQLEAERVTFGSQNLLEITG